MATSGMGLARNLSRVLLSVRNSTGFLGPSPVIPQNLRLIHTTACRRDLMEFFDDKINWGAREVRSGRSWTCDELRIKSNEDLHKLWFVLYKEKNMLLTMEAECERVAELYPNPERVYKVEESMTNLQEVIKERDRAVKLLEIGITGERPAKQAFSFTGGRYRYRYEEHLMPYWRNPRHFKRRYVQDRPVGAMLHYMLKSREKRRKARLGRIAYEQAVIHSAAEEHPDHPLWEEKELGQLRLKDVYHTKMSD